MKERLKIGFTYEIEVVRNGVVIDRETVHNLMPVEGMNHVLNTVLKGGTQVPNWYVGIFEGNYTPLDTDTAATFPASATECVDYDEAARVPLVLGAVALGDVHNMDAPAEFTSNAATPKMIYGGFISSVSGKGSTTGVLLSAARFSSPKPFESGDIVRVTAGINLFNE